MSNSELPFEAPRRLRALVRSRETSVIVLAAAIGAAAGLIVEGMGAAVDLLHHFLFGIAYGERLSAMEAIHPLQAAIIPIGGLLFGLSLLLVARFRPEREVDPIEANALHGGRMSLRGSLIVAAQTVWSSGVGASVGLEAGYTQLASGVASWLGRVFRLRRNDLRLLVGSGAAGAIAGAFGAPFGGAFYAFELVIGSYTPIGLAPLGIAALDGYLVAKAINPATLGVLGVHFGTVGGRDLIIASAFGLTAGFFGIALMRGVAFWERLQQMARLPIFLRPAIGGAIVGALALITPQVLSSGHGALRLAAIFTLPLAAIALIFLLKAIAAIASLGSGFRGGLFFASLLLGSLGGQLFAATGNYIFPDADLDAGVYAIIGMGALSASVIGGPLTMTFIALETTGDFWLATAVLIAVIISNLLTRELFGYSFATWRFHLRGETIRSAADIGWIRDLSVARMMRPDAKTVAKDTSIADFRRAFPLGSATRVIAVDRDGKYAGMAIVADIHALENPDVQTIAGTLLHKDVVLLPGMNIQEAAKVFDRSESESLAVVNSLAQRQVIGLLTEAYTLRRYAAESEQRRREVLGEA